MTVTQELIRLRNLLHFANCVYGWLGATGSPSDRAAVLKYVSRLEEAVSRTAGTDVVLRTRVMRLETQLTETGKQVTKAVT